MTDAATYLLAGPFELLEALVKLPGLFVLQYLFYWNWKRIIDPDTWQVILAGLGVWAILATVATLVVMYG